MGNIKESGFTARDIALLLEALKGSRATMLKYRGLEIVLETDNKLRFTNADTPVNEREPYLGRPSLAVSEPSTPEMDLEGLTEEDRLELLKITDPEEYEKKILTGELEDAEST